MASFLYTTLCNAITLAIVLFLSSGIVTREYTAVSLIKEGEKRVWVFFHLNFLV